MNVLATTVFFSVFLTLSVCDQSYNTIWPLPQKYLVEPTGKAVSLSTGFSIEANRSSKILDRAILRYWAIIMESDVDRKYASSCVNATITIDKLYVDVVSQDENLNIDTSYDYTLTVNQGNAKVTASTIYGAM